MATLLLASVYLSGVLIVQATTAVLLKWFCFKQAQFVPGLFILLT